MVSKNKMKKNLREIIDDCKNNGNEEPKTEKNKKTVIVDRFSIE
jgi:hypothetical protein